MTAWVRARLRMVATTDGGRRGPISSGYRPNWDFGERDGDIPVFWMGQVDVGDGVWLQPGDEADVRIEVVGDRWATVQVGDVVDVREGRMLVGRATITEVHVQPDAR